MRPKRSGGRTRFLRRDLAIPGYLCLAALTLLGIGHERARRSRTATAAWVEPLTVAATAYVGNCSIAAAHANGYFASERLRVTLRVAPTGRDALAAVLERRADLATVADVPIMFATLAGKPVRVIATISTGAKDHGIVGRRDRGVTTVRDLRGKRVAVPIGTSAHFFLEALLNRERLSPHDVTLLDVAPDRLAGALVSGAVDAIAIWQPFVAAAAESLDRNRSVFHGEAIYDVMYNLVAAGDAAPARGVVFQRFLRAVVRGAEFCRTRPQAAQQVVARTFALDASRVRAIWPSYNFRVGLPQALLLALEDQTRWAIRNGLAAAPHGYNYLDRLHLDPLRAVAPNAMTVVH